MQSGEARGPLGPVTAMQTKCDARLSKAFRNEVKGRILLERKLKAWGIMASWTQRVEKRDSPSKLSKCSAPSVCSVCSGGLRGHGSVVPRKTGMRAALGTWLQREMLDKMKTNSNSTGGVVDAMESNSPS